MQGRGFGSRAAGIRGCSPHQGACRLPSAPGFASSRLASFGHRPPGTPGGSGHALCAKPRPSPRPTPTGPAPPQPTPSGWSHPKSQGHRGPPAETRVGGSWGELRLWRERGSGRTDLVGDPAPGRCRAPEPFGLTTRLSSGSSCNGKCQEGFFASSCAIEADSMSFNGDNN